ncbi:MAG TPA: hypothetical protein VL400_08150 [Polyangiaceae bacterium]|jgi:hypothetical protein|nr:hypothetical protein [Polyangiaceae bacterium]
MSSIAFHITSRLADGRVIAADPAARRGAARVILTIGRLHHLVAFHIVDTHIHFLVACARADAGLFARAVESALRFRLALPVPFEPARITPVSSQSHLTNAFLYILRQESHHGVALDPFFDGSSIADILGLRAFGLYTRTNAARLLPRLLSDTSPPLDTTLAEHDGIARHLVEAATSAACLPNLHGRSVAVRQARAAAIQATAGILSPRQQRTVLQISRSARQRARALPVDEALLGAVRNQLDTRLRPDALAAIDLARGLTLPKRAAY